MMETVVQTLLNFPAQEHLAIKVRQVVCPQHKRNKTKKILLRGNSNKITDQDIDVSSFKANIYEIYL